MMSENVLPSRRLIDSGTSIMGDTVVKRYAYVGLGTLKKIFIDLVVLHLIDQIYVNFNKALEPLSFLLCHWKHFKYRSCTVSTHSIIQVLCVM